MSELKRILYIEDEPDIQAIAKIALESLGGFEIKICSSGEEAIANAVSFMPDLLLMDVMMPGLNGPDTYSILREMPALIDIPAIFMTAKVQTSEVDEYKKIGALGVIAKPFDPMTLADQIKTIYQSYSDSSKKK